MSIFLACSGAFWRKFSYICTYADITFITEYTRMQPKNNNYRFFDLIIPSASTRIGENSYKTLVKTETESVFSSQTSFQVNFQVAETVSCTNCVLSLTIVNQMQQGLCNT